MNLNKLEELKRILQEAKKLDQPMDFFLTNFGERPEFVQCGKRTEDPRLMAILEAVAGRVARAAPKVSHVVLTKLPKHNFIHGGFVANGMIGTVFYFEDIEVGLAAFTRLASSQMLFARFSASDLPEGWEPSRN